MHSFNLSVLTEKWTGRKLHCGETCCSALSICLMDRERHGEREGKKGQKLREVKILLYGFIAFTLAAVKRGRQERLGEPEATD